MKRHFVKLLRTPALLAMFSKDPTSAAQAQIALQTLADLDPWLIMPELLERAYSGLEGVNETHRTTAVLGAIAFISRPIVTESQWLGGQKHILPLLELCLPGIDLVCFNLSFVALMHFTWPSHLQNDPTKTICSAMFITVVVRKIKIGDLSATASQVSFDDGMEVDEHVDHIPDGSDANVPANLSREDERSLIRDSTASFAGKPGSMTPPLVKQLMPVSLQIGSLASSDGYSLSSKIYLKRAANETPREANRKKLFSNPSRR